MKVCYTAGPVKKLENCFSVSTNAVEIRIWFLTDDILRIRAGFDGDWDEASYSLTMTAWDSRTDELMKDCRKRVQTAAAELTDGDKQAVIQGSRLKVVVEKAPFRIMVYDKDGSLLHADIPDLAYREDSNHRRMHASQIEADDCFYGFGEKSGEINKAEHGPRRCHGLQCQGDRFLVQTHPVLHQAEPRYQTGSWLLLPQHR